MKITTKEFLELLKKSKKPVSEFKQELKDKGFTFSLSNEGLNAYEMALLEGYVGDEDSFSKSLVRKTKSLDVQDAGEQIVQNMDNVATFFEGIRDIGQYFIEMRDTKIDKKEHEEKQKEAIKGIRESIDADIKKLKDEDKKLDVRIREGDKALVKEIVAIDNRIEKVEKNMGNIVADTYSVFSGVKDGLSQESQERIADVKSINKSIEGLKGEVSKKMDAIEIDQDFAKIDDENIGERTTFSSRKIDDSIKGIKKYIKENHDLRLGGRGRIAVSIDGAEKLLTDNLNLVAGSNVTLSADTSTNSVTISSTGGGGSPGGSDTQVQFNDGGVFGGDAGMTFNKTTNKLTVTGSIQTDGSFLAEGGNMYGNGELYLYSGTGEDQYIALKGAGGVDMDFQAGGGDYAFGKGGGSLYAYLNVQSISASRTYTLPDATGTIALTSDIPTITYGTDNQIPYVNAGGTDFDYSSDYTYDGSKLNLTGATQAELANLTATITSNTNNRTLKISTTNNQASGSGTATGGLSVTTTDNGVTSGGATMATLGMQFTVSRSSTYSNSGLAGTLRAIQGTVTNSGNYIDTASNRSVTVEGSQVALVTSPTVNTTSTTLTQSTRAFSATLTGTPVITSGSLTADYFGYYLAGTGNTVGTSTLKAFYNSLTGYDTNWTFYNDTANNNFLGNDNSKTYFGTGFDASIYYDGTDLYINPKEVGSGNLIVSGDVSVTDEAYDATNWNGSLEVPTKNAIRDKIESLSAGSGITRTVVVTSGSATMGNSASTDYMYFVAGAHTMSLPAASGNTNRYTVKNNHSANITIDTAGAENIEGAASISIAPEESVDIMSDGTNWFII